jgi:hypothetical protein
MKLETGDIILEKGEDVIDKGISWFTDSPYTHVAMVIHENFNLLIESHFWSGVHIIHLNEIPDKYDVLRIKGGLNSIQKEKIFKPMLESIGNKYDLPQIFGYLFSGLFKGKNMFNNPNYIICSELIDIVYNEIDIDLVPDMYLGDIKPSDIAKCDKLEIIS